MKKNKRLDAVVNFKENIRRNRDSGKIIYAILASIFLPEIALPFWVKSGYSNFRGLLMIIIIAAAAYLLSFFIIMLSVNGLLDWIKWEWFNELKSQWANTNDGFTFIGLFIMGLVPDVIFIGITVRAPIYGYITILPYANALVMLLAIFSGIAVRLIIVNLFIDRLIRLYRFLKKRIKNSKSPE